MNSDTVKTIAVKFRLVGGSRRRARLNIPLTMAAVTHKLKTSFTELKTGQFAITYCDEEGDEIEVLTNADLVEAMAVFNAIGRVLSFTVVVLPEPTTKNDGRNLHFRPHFRRRNHMFRRWHSLAHMLDLRPQDMQPQMQDMFRFGMLQHFASHGHGMAAHKDLQCTFVADATIPDGSTMQPRQRFDKTWVVKSGKNAWPAGCTLAHVGGHPLGTKRHKFRPAPLEAVAANSEVELTLALQAPNCRRNFVSKWRMCTPDGQQFGDYLWVTFHVDVDQREAAGVVAMSAEPDLECKFVADVTIPDGSTMQPQQLFDKKWVVKTGKNSWPAGCTLVHVTGHAMGTKRRKFRPAPLKAVAANSELELMLTLQAPPKCPRDFVSKWRMCTPDGRQFGDYLWTFINVEQREAGASAAAKAETGLECEFVADATIPDRSTVQPKQRFDKKWVVKTGTKPWPAGCTLVHVGGHPMGTKRPKFRPASLGVLPANSEVVLTVTLKAPKPCRDFVSKWRMCTPDGHQFGAYLWALINVGSPSEVVVAAAGPADPEAASVVAAGPADPDPVSAVAPATVAPATASVSPTTTTTAVTSAPSPSAGVQQLLDMGFSVPAEILASVLVSTGGDVRAAVARLLRQQ